MIKKSGAVLFLAFGLTACGVPTVEELVEDPELLQESVEECKSLSLGEMKDSELCNNVTEAVVKSSMIKLNDFMKGMNDDQ